MIEELELARFLLQMEIVPENVLGKDGRHPQFRSSWHRLNGVVTNAAGAHAPVCALTGLEAFLTFSTGELRTSDRARNPDYWYWELPANHPAKSLQVGLA